MNKAEIQSQALFNATTNQSERNYDDIFNEFADMGIPVEDIKPRENVFTYNAWKALNRQVTKGSHGVKVVTFVPMTKKDKETGEKSTFRRPKTTTVFHISQTEIIDKDKPTVKPDLSIVNLKPITPEYKTIGGVVSQDSGPKTMCDNARVKQVEKYRELGDKLSGQIEDKFADRLQNTPKRVAQAAHARFEGERLKRTQAALYALADMTEAGTMPDILHKIKSKKAVYDLVGEKVNHVNNGYHGYAVGTGEPNDNSSEAAALWETLKPKSDSEKKAEELEVKIRGLQFSQIPGYFPTPKPVIDLMLEYADIYSSNTVLEPSAGNGAIADAVKPLCLSIDTVEANYTLSDILKAKGYPVTNGDFMKTDFNVGFDRVLMNPPFENLQDVDHIKHAYSMLGDMGRLVSVMSPSAFSRQDKKCVEFREWFESLGGEKIELPENSFKESGTNISTVMVIIDKN